MFFFNLGGWHIMIVSLDQLIPNFQIYILNTSNNFCKALIVHEIHQYRLISTCIKLVSVIIVLYITVISSYHSYKYQLKAASYNSC